MIEISQIANGLNLSPDQYEMYGRSKAKIKMEAVLESSGKKGKLVLVTAINPTPTGEGKTVTAIGLSMALNRLGRKTVVCVRQPSLGPVFGVKGGAAGGGRATVEPMQEINLRFTGDIDAIGASHNLLAAMVDNHIFQGNELGLEIHSVSLNRVVDMNDRALRRIVVGLGAKSDGIPREGGYIITAASEVMAVLCMSLGYADLKKRLGRIITGFTKGSRPVTAEDLKATGAMAAILKEALQPNLVQTAEGTPALIHGGPFGNIALGTCSLSSITFALLHSEFAVVEAGFGSDLGGEKFFDIVSRVGGFNVDCTVIVTSVKALEYHGGFKSSADPNAGSRLASLQRGLENLGKHLENVQNFGIQPVVCINRFSSDSEDEVRLIQDYCKNRLVECAVSTTFAQGGEGCLELAHRVISSSEKGFRSMPLYNFEEDVEAKIEKIVTKIYGGDSVEFEPESKKSLSLIQKLGFSNLPICMAKTPLSLSDDPKKIGRPRNFVCTVKRLEVAAGAGYIIAHLGDIVSMPGLPEKPAAEKIEMDDAGNITGLY
ncbi:MAG TPA: formate--tetrahydrofolate ligase [Nitrososphaerales archaeon]|nr:formate--tetrahydrofolate ligase [Nitrososphaerales archaeon]